MVHSRDKQTKANTRAPVHRTKEAASNAQGLSVQNTTALPDRMDLYEHSNTYKACVWNQLRLQLNASTHKVIPPQFNHPEIDWEGLVECSKLL
jgi:hypothetical protein